MSFFLSYSRQDQAEALSLAQALKGAGVPVWVDQLEILPSQHWDRAVEAAVRGCEGMIVILSPHSAASPNVADEVAVALDEGKTVIPVLIAACKPPLRLARMQYIDASRDRAAAVRRCLAAIAEQRDPETAARPPVEASAPAGGNAVAVDVGEAALATMTRALARQLGPIAAEIVRRERRQARSAADLRARLAQRVGAGDERSAFLRETASLA